MKKRILAVLSAVSVALSSAACITLFASAEGSDYTVTADVMTEEWLSANESIITGKTVSVKNGNDSSTTTTTLITDGKLGTDYTNWTVYSDFKPYDFTCELGGLYSISKIAFCGQSASGSPYFAGYTPKRVQIFLSNKKSDLYSGTPVIDYTVVNDQYNKTHSWLFDLKSSVNAKYIGLRVLETNPSGNTGDGPFKIEEFGVYGDSIPEPEVKEGDKWFNLSGNILKNKTATIINPNKENPAEANFNYVSKITDNDPDTNYANWTAYQNYKPIDITFELGASYDITKIALSGHSNKTIYTYSPKEFRIYLSNDKESLYNGTPVIEFETDSPEKVSNWLFNLPSSVSSKYVGLRIVTPNHTDGTFIIEEFGVYDYYTVDSETATLTDDNDYFIPYGSVLNADGTPAEKDTDGKFNVACGAIYRKFAKPASNGITTFGVSYKANEDTTKNGIQFGSYTESVKDKEFYTLIIRGSDETTVNAFSDEELQYMATTYMQKNPNFNDKWIKLYKNSADETAKTNWIAGKVIRQKNYMWKDAETDNTKLQYAVRLYGDYSGANGTVNFSAIGFSKSGDTVSFADSFKTASYNGLAN